MTDSSFAYVHVPDLPIQVERRRHPELRGRPVLVVSRPPGRGGQQLVEAASDEARALRVAPGQTPRQAEHLCPEAVVVTADSAAYEAVFGALLAALGGCSPIVQVDRAAWGAELDVDGLELLFGPDPALAAELLHRTARTGLRARVGLGPNRLVARLAAGLAGPGRFIVVAPSETRTFLRSLPVDGSYGHPPLLSEESRERLELLGVRSLGQLLRLPRAGLARQVGPDALALVRAAEADGELLVPHRPAEWLVAATELETPLETREHFSQLIRPLAKDLAARLRERYLGAGAVRLRLAWTDTAIGSRSDEGPAPAGGGRACPERSRRARGPRNSDWSAQLPTRTDSGDEILEAVARLAGDPPGRPYALPAEDARPPDWLELAVGDLGPLGGRQAGLFEGQGGRRTQAARAVDELAERFRGRLRAPAFGQGT